MSMLRCRLISLTGLVCALFWVRGCVHRPACPEEGADDRIVICAPGKDREFPGDHPGSASADRPPLPSGTESSSALSNPLVNNPLIKELKDGASDEGCLFRQPEPFRGTRLKVLSERAVKAGGNAGVPAGVEASAGPKVRRRLTRLQREQLLADLRESDKERRIREHHCRKSAAGRIPLEEAFPPQSVLAAVGRTVDAGNAAGKTRPVFHVVRRGETLWSISNLYGFSPGDFLVRNPQIRSADNIKIGQSLAIPWPRASGKKASASPGPLKEPVGAASPRSSPPQHPSVGRSSLEHSPGRMTARSGLSRNRFGAGSHSVRRVTTGAAPVVKPAGPRNTVRHSAPDRPVTNRALARHVLRKGETLWTLARRYRTTVTNLMLLNRLGEASNLKPGLVLLVPGGGNSTLHPVKPAGTKEHVVAKGDTLWGISRRYGITVENLLKWNDMKDLKNLAPGQRLLVAPPGRTKSGVSAVQGLRRPSSPVVPAARPPTPGRVGKAGFTWPIRGDIDRTFGWYDGRPHTGVDIQARIGAQVKAAAAGRVIFADNMPGYGRVVILDHGNGYFTVYGNLLENLVRKGSPQRPVVVRKGQVIARVGAGVEGPKPHLHFEIRKGNKAINPLRLLKY